MKRLLATYVMGFICSLAIAQESHHTQTKFTFGVEYGVANSFITATHYNFFDPDDAYRVDIQEWQNEYNINGEVLLHVGYNINRNWNISLYSGYAGAGSYHATIPVFVRTTRFFKESAAGDRWFTFLDAGSGVDIKGENQYIFQSRLGGGYRLSLCKYAKIDFMTSIRVLYTHPDIIYYGQVIPLNLINRNNAYIPSINLGVGITF